MRSIEGISMRRLPDESHRHAARRQKLLQVADGVLGEMKDRRGQRRIGAARCEDVGEVIRCAGAARRDDRNPHGVADGGGELAVESRPGAVAVDRRQQDLAGAAAGGLARPVDGASRVRATCRCG